MSDASMAASAFIVLLCSAAALAAPSAASAGACTQKASRAARRPAGDEGIPVTDADVVQGVRQLPRARRQAAG